MNETRASSQKAEPAVARPLPDGSFSAQQAVAAASDFAELRVNPEGVFWSEFQPADSATRVWQWRNGQARCLTPQGFSVRSRVYEYGGGSFCLADDALVFVNERDQQLYRQALDGSAPQPLTHDVRRYGDLRFANGLVLAVEEEPAEPYPVHRLVAIGADDGARRVLVEGADFYAAPVLCPDGSRLAWIEWSRPHQPWTATRLMCAERTADGRSWHKPYCIAGDSEVAEALQQPCIDAQGRVQCLSDRNGYWQPWRESPTGWHALPAATADHASAPWQLGATSWLPLADHTYLATWFETGLSRLGLCSDADGSVLDYTGEFSRLRSLAADTRCFYAIAASATRPSAIIAIDRRSHEVQVLAGGQTPIETARISLPRAMTYPSGEASAHCFFYPPSGDIERPPLLVFIHGGPTSASYPVFDPRIQYWTQRGFAIADINYRGSTGYGRAYRQALHLNWGVSDVDDACAAVQYLADAGLVDARRAFIRGSSAGGYTTLCALAFRDVFRAGGSLYGVSDPAALARDTHKFESDYLDWLIGDPDRDAQRYAARTPLLHAEQIRVPVIFFQGELDAVVVPQQTRSMLEAVQRNGIPAVGHFYPEERHGFRQAANLAHALEEEWKFYCAVMAED
jgi:dipeptidyl aminopeptidase/acylaminoacyl peptidase